MSAWTASGNQVARTNVTRWAMDRQVRLVAGSIVLASVAASVWFRSARFVAGFARAGITFCAVTNTCGMAMSIPLLGGHLI